MMRPVALLGPLAGLAVAIAMVNPAAAAWKTEDNSVVDEYLTTGMAEDGRAKFVIVCYANAPVLDMTILTGEPYGSHTTYPNGLPISVTTDGRQQPVIRGVFHNYGGELVAVSNLSIDRTLLRLFHAMAASISTVDVQFDQRKYRFSSEGLGPALRHLYDKCK